MTAHFACVVTIATVGNAGKTTVTQMGYRIVLTSNVFFGHGFGECEQPSILFVTHPTLSIQNRIPNIQRFSTILDISSIC